MINRILSMTLWMKYVNKLQQWHFIRQNMHTLTTGDLKILLKMLMLKKRQRLNFKLRLELVVRALKKANMNLWGSVWGWAPWGWNWAVTGWNACWWNNWWNTSTCWRLWKKLTSVIQKESFGNSNKVVEIIARMEQIKIASENTLTEFYDHRDKIKNSQMKQGKVTSFSLPKKIYLNHY